jgi:endo-1,4-beta-xylanase
MKKLILLLALALLASCTTKANNPQELGLKDALKDKFLIGVAMNLDYIWERNAKADAAIKKHFNSIVAENCMKSMYMQPEEGVFFWDDADRFIEFGEQNNMFIIGHTLIWHSQAPDWFFIDENGNDVSREVLIERMRMHVHTIVARYKGRVHGWDVVNEAILNDGTWRDNKFYQILGKDYVRLAFEFAHEADPNAELYYNDYNEWHVGKRDGVVGMINELKAQGIRIDAMGMQGHWGMDYPQLDEIQAAIDAYVSTGVKVMITELDITALPTARRVSAEISETEEYRAEMNPYVHGISAETAEAWTNRVLSFFQLFLDNSQHITRVTMWGLSDGASWKNNHPIPGRTDYPLLFDRNYDPKPVINEIIKLVAP